MAKWTLYKSDYIKLFIVLFCFTSCQAYTPSGFEGCYRFTNRVLERVLYSRSDNNGDDCKDACSSAGYAYAGTRAMNCWCGQSIGTEKTEGSCEWGCLPGQGERCGGLYGISVYDADYTVNVVAIVVSVIVVIIVIIIVVVVVIICMRRRKANREKPERNISEFRSERSERSLEPKKREPPALTNKGYSDYKGPPSHMRAPVSLSPEDDSSYRKKKRTWSQHDEDDYDADSNFTPIPMDDQDYSSYPKTRSRNDSFV